ncbi:MAG: peptidylprolyl isomerase [Thermoguttaceae bacterium]
MRNPGKLVVAFVITLTLSALVGCQRGGNAAQSAPAAVNGPEGQPAQAAADSGPAAKSAQDPMHPVVAIETSLGSFSVRLDAEKAPVTVENFLSYVASNFYDQTIFHQVLTGYPKLALGGAFTPDAMEKKARTPIYNEAHNGLKNRRGTIAMARLPDDVNSATSAFYVNLADNQVLDHKDRTVDGYGYCVFGEVVEGLDVVERIAQVPVRDTEKLEHVPVQAVLIKSTHRIR